MIIVMGLGNPGKEHKDNRHNIGFMILDESASREGISFEEKSILHANTIKIGELLLAKPVTYMNQSGTTARLLLREYQAPLVVVYDEINVPLGEIKCSFGRGSGDHNGVQSIIDTLGTKDFFRIRVGVRPTHEELMPRIAPPDGFEKFLLSDFTELEKDKLKEGIEKAINIIRDLPQLSFNEIMNKYN